MMRLLKVLALFMFLVSSSGLQAAINPSPILQTTLIAGTSQESAANEEEDRAAAKRVEDDTARKEKQEKRKDILVYSCFGLSLVLLLWMRRQSKTKQEVT